MRERIKKIIIDYQKNKKEAIGLKNIFKKTFQV